MSRGLIVKSLFVVVAAVVCLVAFSLTSVRPLSSWLRLTIPANNTLVIFLNRYAETSSDVSGAKTWLSDDLAANIVRLSFNVEPLSFTFAGPYVGEIENCGPGSNTHRAIVDYGVNRAYRAGIDPSQYNHFIVLRNSDFWGDDCANLGNGGYLDAMPYEGGVLYRVGVGTIAPPSQLSRPFSGEIPAGAVHEFLHGYGRGTSHASQLVCFSDPANPDTTRVPYYHLANEHVLLSPYCQRTAGSLLDVMGSPLNDYLEVNSILKMQYRWLAGGNIATIISAALGSGRTIPLKPIETPATAEEIQMVVMPIPGTTKAYVLELRGGAAPSGAGVYLYLMPDRIRPAYNEQYLLYTGEVYQYGTPPAVVQHPAPMRLGQTIIDSKMKLAVTITSVSSTVAILHVFTTP